MPNQSANCATILPQLANQRDRYRLVVSLSMAAFCDGFIPVALSLLTRAARLVTQYRTSIDDLQSQKVLTALS